MDLRFQRSAARGSLSSTSAPASLYTAPETEGPDQVTFRITDRNGKEEVRTISFNVLIRTATPTSTLTPTTTPTDLTRLTVTPRPTDTPETPQTPVPGPTLDTVVIDTMENRAV